MITDYDRKYYLYCMVKVTIILNKRLVLLSEIYNFVAYERR